MLTDDEIQKLLEGTEGVTPGPWRLIGWHPNGLYGPGDLHSAKAICHFTNQMPDKEKVAANRDPEHIARCDPSTIAELCTRLLSAEAEVRRLNRYDWLKPDAYEKTAAERDALQARVKVLESALARYPNEEHAAVLEAGK
jgi:hypothetical protein